MPGPSEKVPDVSPEDGAHGQEPEQVMFTGGLNVPGKHAWQLVMPSPK